MVLQPAMFSYVMAYQVAHQQANGHAMHGNVMQHGQDHAAVHQHQHHHQQQHDQKQTDGQHTFNCCQSAACGFAVTATPTNDAPVFAATRYELHQPHFFNVILPTELRPPRSPALG